MGGTAPPGGRGRRIPPVRTRPLATRFLSAKRARNRPKGPASNRVGAGRQQVCRVQRPLQSGRGTTPELKGTRTWRPWVGGPWNRKVRRLGLGEQDPQNLCLRLLGPHPAPQRWGSVVVLGGERGARSTARLSPDRRLRGPQSPTHEGGEAPNQVRGGRRGEWGPLPLAAPRSHLPGRASAGGRPEGPGGPCDPTQPGFARREITNGCGPSRGTSRDA